MDDCDILKMKIRDMASHLNIETFQTSRPLKGTCILDIKDKELHKEISEKISSDIDSLLNTTSSVVINSEKNIIEAELPVSFVKLKSTGEKSSYGKLESTDDCKINEIHFHGGLAPASHVHFHCDVINKERTLTRVARLISDANYISRKMAKS